MLEKILVVILSVIAIAHCNGKLSILTSPKGVQFEGNTPLQQSLIKEVYTVALGLTSEQASSWNGINKINPFYLPRAIVTFVVEGIDSLDVNAKAVYPLEVDEGLTDTWSSLETRLAERFPSDGLPLLNMDLPNGNFNSERVFGVVAPKVLEAQLDDDDESKLFLKEAGVLSGLIEQVPKLTAREAQVPTLYVFHMSSFNGLVKKSKENTEKAKVLVSELITELSKAFDKVYKGKVIVSVLTTNDVLSRRTRQAAKEEEVPDYNLAKNYNSNYPVIFNIMLWFGVAFFFSLLAISISISTMDPGRDSIIYRMTSTRIKKEN